MKAAMTPAMTFKAPVSAWEMRQMIFALETEVLAEGRWR